MTEKSILWTTGATGDGTSPYTATEMFAWLRRTFIASPTTEGVLIGYGNALAVTTAGTTKVTVGTGSAYAYGLPYESDAAVDVAIPTPASATRVDYVVLRVAWAAQTVRITRIAGTEGAGAPALTQTPGTTYDVPLATASITTGGAITVTDARGYCHFASRAATQNIDDLAVTTAKLAADAVTAAKLADDAVLTANILNANVTKAKLGAGIWTEDNDGAASGLDADKIDGTHLAELATISAGGVVCPSGGTIKGISVQVFTGTGHHAHGLAWTPNVVLPIIRGPTAYASVGIDTADATNVHINSTIDGQPFIVLMMLVA
jgi:hypothetical protein